MGSVNYVPSSSWDNLGEIPVCDNSGENKLFHGPSYIEMWLCFR